MQRQVYVESEAKKKKKISSGLYKAQGYVLVQKLLYDNITTIVFMRQKCSLFTCLQDVFDVDLNNVYVFNRKKHIIQRPTFWYAAPLIRSEHRRC